MCTARLKGTGQRWVAELANLQFDIPGRCQPGGKNHDADVLSPMPPRTRWRATERSVFGGCLTDYVKLSGSKLSRSSSTVYADFITADVDNLEITTTSIVTTVLPSITLDKLKAPQANN